MAEHLVLVLDLARHCQPFTVGDAIPFKTRPRSTEMARLNVLEYVTATADSGRTARYKRYSELNKRVSLDSMRVLKPQDACTVALNGLGPGGTSVL